MTFLGWLSDPFKGQVTSNWGIKRSRPESPGRWWFDFFLIMLTFIWGRYTKLDLFFLKDWLSHHLAIMNNYTGSSLKTPFPLNFILSGNQDLPWIYLESPGSKTNSDIFIYKIIPLRIRFYVLTNGIFPEPNHIDLGMRLRPSNFYWRKGVWILRLQRYVVSLPQYVILQQS